MSTLERASRRLRHVRAVCVRNLEHAAVAGPIDCYCTLHVGPRQCVALASTVVCDTLVRWDLRDSALGTSFLCGRFVVLNSFCLLDGHGVLRQNPTWELAELQQHAIPRLLATNQGTHARFLLKLILAILSCFRIMSLILFGLDVLVEISTVATLRIWNRPIDPRTTTQADKEWPDAAAAFNPIAVVAPERAPLLPSQTPSRSYSIGGAFLSTGSMASFDLNGASRIDDAFAPPRALDDDDTAAGEAGSTVVAPSATPFTRQRQSSDAWRWSSIAESSAESVDSSAYSVPRREMLVCKCASSGTDELGSGNASSSFADSPCMTCILRDSNATPHVAACLCQNVHGWFRHGDSLLFESEIRLADLKKLNSKVCL
jgi:hypothetical protein